MDRALQALLVAGLVLAIVGVSVTALLAPAYTRHMVDRVDSSALADLPPDETARLAEEVRAYVAGDPDAALPARLPDGRLAFDDKAVSHLDDVRDVLGAARVATILAILAGFGAVALLGVRRAVGSLARGLRWSGRLLVGAVALAALLALADFGRFFAAFHGLFFEPGTWQFAADALLIRLFPEPFWVSAGIAWGALILLGGILTELAGRTIERCSCRTDA